MAIHAMLTPFLIIVFNPKLFSKCKQLLFCGKSNSIGDVAAIRTAIGGQQLVIDNDEQSRHFEQLRKAWN
jgi:hypothetical protein